MRFGISLALTHAPKEFVESALKSEQVDFVEVAIEGFLYRSDKVSKDQLKRILDSKPATAHGYSLSLLDPQNWNQDRLQRHGTFFKQNRFLAWSDHYAITSWMGRNFASLTPAPTGNAAESLLKGRLEQIHAVVSDLPFYLENPAAPFMVEAKSSTVDVFARVLRGSKTKMLLDLSNLAANETNFGINAEEEIERLHGIGIGQIHLAGGNWDRGFYRDSHSSAVTERSWELLRKIRPLLGDDTLILIEREQKHPPFAEMVEELSHARRICGV